MGAVQIDYYIHLCIFELQPEFLVSPFITLIILPYMRARIEPYAREHVGNLGMCRV